MSFFVTSVGPGCGGDLGGLEGADAYCTALAEAAGVTGKTWAAYLSTSSVNARDRIGRGLGQRRGRVIAESVEALHGDGNTLTKETALDETGAVVNGRGDEPNRHDILTGSLPDGTAAPETCEDWTSTARHRGHGRAPRPDGPRRCRPARPGRGASLARRLRHRGAARHRRRRPLYCFAPTDRRSARRRVRRPVRAGRSRDVVDPRFTGS